MIKRWNGEIKVDVDESKCFPIEIKINVGEKFSEL